jgi:hypothetical protein
LEPDFLNPVKNNSYLFRENTDNAFDDLRFGLGVSFKPVKVEHYILEAIFPAVMFVSPSTSNSASAQNGKLTIN